MAKQSSSYLSPKKVLANDKGAYEQYKETKIAAKRLALLQKTRQTKALLPRAERQERYEATRSGRFASGLTTGLRFLQSPTRALNQPPHQFGRKKERQTTYGRYASKAGRPMGTYNKMYAQYGGVYGWRKAMAQQRRLQQLEYLRSVAQTPNQQAAFRSIEARRMAQMRDMEAAPIPNTNGQVYLSDIMDEIDLAANIAG
jgi:hypothetical protein